jgi:hypothetical protein
MLICIHFSFAAIEPTVDEFEEGDFEDFEDNHGQATQGKLIRGGLRKPSHHVRQQHPLSSLTSSRRGREGRRRTIGKKLGSTARRGGS